MRFKLDENLPAVAAARLVQAGHDAETVRGEGLSGTDDENLFRVAGAEDRALVTLDLDFSNPVRFPPAGTAGTVVLRVRRPSPRLVLLAMESMLAFAEHEELRGRLWIVEPGWVRVHTPDVS